MKVVINRCFGGFSLSQAVYKDLNIPWDGYGFLNNKGLVIDDSFDSDSYRADPRLIAAVEKVGVAEAGGGSCAALSIVEIPDGVDFCIHEHDGMESIHEKHRSWS